VSDAVVDPSPASIPDAGDDDLVIDNLSKTFPGQRALNEVSFRVRPGAVHAQDQREPRRSAMRKHVRV